MVALAFIHLRLTALVFTQKGAWPFWWHGTDKLYKEIFIMSQYCPNHSLFVKQLWQKETKSEHSQWAIFSSCLEYFRLSGNSENWKSASSGRKSVNSSSQGEVIYIRDSEEIRSEDSTIQECVFCYSQIRWSSRWLIAVTVTSLTIQRSSGASDCITWFSSANVLLLMFKFPFVCVFSLWG